jgi:hypothetical protein
MRSVLDQRGFAIVEDVFAAVDLDRYVAALEAALAREHLAVRRRADVFAARDLFDAVPETRPLIAGDRFRSLVRELLGVDARIVRALYFDKPPRSNWLVPWHQDQFVAVQRREEVPGFSAWTKKAGVVHARAPAEILERMVTLRIHLDVFDERAAPLRVGVGSDRLGRISAEAIAGVVAASEQATCRVPRGGVLAMRPLLMHSSPRASADVQRRVVHLELADFDLPPPLCWHRVQSI